MKWAKIDGKNHSINELYNDHMVIKKDVYKEFRKVSQSGEINCIDCGKRVIFRAGKIYKPHFAHFKLSNTCEYEKIIKTLTKHHIKGEEQLLNWIQKCDEVNISDIKHHSKIGDSNYRVSFILDKMKIGIDFLTYIPKMEMFSKKQRRIKSEGIYYYPIFSEELYNDKNFVKLEINILNEGNNNSIFYSVNEKKFILRDYNEKIVKNTIKERIPIEKEFLEDEFEFEKINDKILNFTNDVKRIKNIIKEDLKKEKLKKDDKIIEIIAKILDRSVSKKEVKILKKYIDRDVNTIKGIIFSKFGYEIIKKIENVLKEMKMTEMRVSIREILFDLRK